MSDTLAEVSQSSLLAAEAAVLLLAPEDELPAIIIEPADFFEPTCAVVLPEQGTTGADEHPFGSYNISYPYCRTALRVTVDDIDPSPLLAQITGFARYLSARIVALVCGLETKLASLTVLETFPVSTQNCAVFGVVHPKTNQGFLIVDGTKAVLPTQILLQLVVETGQSRAGWINVLPPGWTSE